MSCPMLRVVVLYLAVVATSSTPNILTSSIWGWKCENEACSEVRLDLGNDGMSRARCQLTCGKFGSLWPHPTGEFSMGSEVKAFDCIKRATVSPSGEVSSMIWNATDRFQDYVNSLYPSEQLKERSTSSVPVELQVTIYVETNVTSINLNTDESYELKIHINTVEIKAKTFFGARHALESLGQLITYDSKAKSLVIVEECSITDKPVFKHRGMMLDTSRHFYSVDSIKRTIDGLSFNKLNTFHWHITDTTSFPIYCPSQPNMTAFGAYSDQQVYSTEDVKHIVEYAKNRGVRVVPELDTPYHVSHGFEWTNEIGRGEVTPCIEDDFCQLGIPCGHLNPANEFVYSLLGDLYKDLFEMFDTDMFHAGGDEVIVYCWRKTEEVLQWLEQHGLSASAEESYHELWGYFNSRSYIELKQANSFKPVKAVVWTSDLTESDKVEQYIDKNNFAIQIWTYKNDSSIGKLLSKGYQLIFSNSDAWYLDCGFSSYGGGLIWCSPYKTWEQVYNNAPYSIAEQFGYTCGVDGENSRECELILGGEVAMWSESVDEASLDMKVWPKTAALAERLWSNPSTESELARNRFARQRELLVHRGIGCDAFQPAWCNNNENDCKF